jgi:hypothetical protein
MSSENRRFWSTIQKESSIYKKDLFSEGQIKNPLLPFRSGFWGGGLPKLKR